jgi:hypothetical protein
VGCGVEGVGCRLGASTPSLLSARVAMGTTPHHLNENALVSNNNNVLLANTSLLGQRFHSMVRGEEGDGYEGGLFG